MMKTLTVLAVVCIAYSAATATDNLTDVTICHYSGETINEITTYNISNAEQVVSSDEWNPSLSLVILFPGYGENCTSESMTTIVGAFKKHGGYNIVVVNFPRQSTVVNWSEAGRLRLVNNVNAVGTAVGKLINQLVKLGVELVRILLVGYMTGAHAAGQAARIANGTMPRIIGLDPFNHGFYESNSTGHLEKTDALIVEVMHCNGLILSISKPVGTCDYFPNTGYAIQPGCNAPTSWYTLECSSRSCYKFLAYSIINATAFPAVKCDIWTKFITKECSNETSYMGLLGCKNNTGNFYLQTKWQYPYSKGINGTVYEGNLFSIIVAKLINLWPELFGYLIYSSWNWNLPEGTEE